MEGQRKTAGEMIIGYFRDFKVLKETRVEYWGTQIINFLDCTTYFATLSIAAVFLSHDFGFSDENAGYVLTLFTSATTIFLFFSGMVTDWLGIKKSLYTSMIALLLLRLSISLLGLIPTFPFRGVIVAILFFLTAPFMAMVQTVFQAANKRFTTKKSRSAGFNLWYLFMNIGAAAGGFLIDIVRKGLNLPNSHIFTFGVFTGVLCTVVTLIFIRREDQLIGPDEATEESEEKPVVKKKKNPFQIAKDVVSESVFWRLAVLIALLLGVRAVFTYMYLLMPKYWLRIIGPNAAIGTLEAINPILIVIGLILFIPFANKFNIFKMLIYGAMISAMSLIVLVLPWQIFSSDIAAAHYTMAVISLVFLSIGEIIWSPKLNEYTAAVAPIGQEGTYLGLSMVPWFLAKTIVSLVSGHMLTQWCPEGIGEKLKAGTVAFWNSPAAMWLVLAVFALGGPIIARFMKNWLTKGARFQAGDLHSDG